MSSHFHQSRPVTTITSKPSNGSSPKPRLTHFLCIPLGHHAELRETWTRISSALLSVEPPIPGLHTSIIIPPRSLHFTLGVLSLTSENEKQPEESVDIGSDGGALPSSHPIRHKVSDALRLLRSLRDPISMLLRDAPALTVPLERLDVMNADPAHSHVLWAGPDVTQGAGEKFMRVCELVHATFREAGMLQEATRPLKLHCTLINTVHRRPRAKGRSKRVPFSCTAMRASDTYQLMGEKEGEERPWHVDIGTWPAEELQLCEKGRGADGVYRSVGAVSLRQAEYS